MCRLVVLHCSKKRIGTGGKIVPRGVIVTISGRVVAVRDEPGAVSRRGLVLGRIRFTLRRDKSDSFFENLQRFI